MVSRAAHRRWPVVGARVSDGVTVSDGPRNRALYARAYEIIQPEASPSVTPSLARRAHGMSADNDRLTVFLARRC
jgi:hypothetical protein